METAGVPEWKGGRRSQTGPSLPGAQGKRSKTSKSVGSVASVDALDVGFNPVDADMPAEALRVVIPGVRRSFGGRTGRAGGPVHYALYEPGGVL
jgi:hypothetical protein